MATIEYNLNRFLEAQSAAYEIAHSEICAGRKRSHWMWYIFPQLKGLGRSATSEYYGIDGISEAKEFLAHPVLGNRLREITQALIRLDTNDAHRIFGTPDDMKLRSCMTLFDIVSPNDIFNDVLTKFFDGNKDCKTLEQLEI